MPRWSNVDRTPLAILRANAGHSRDTAAAVMGISLSSLIRYENGVNDVPIGLAEEMAVLYHVPFEDVRTAIRETKEAAGVRAVGRAAKTLATKGRNAADGSDSDLPDG